MVLYTLQVVLGLCLSEITWKIEKTNMILAWLLDVWRCAVVIQATTKPAQFK